MRYQERTGAHRMLRLEGFADHTTKVRQGRKQERGQQLPPAQPPGRCTRAKCDRDRGSSWHGLPSAWPVCCCA